MSSPTYFPLRWESTGDQWWYASPIDWAAANGHYDLVRELLRIDGNHLIKLTSLRRIRRLETVWDDDRHFHHVAASRSHVARSLLAECDLTKGPNSLVGSGYGGWLLYTAASAGDLPFVRDLLQRDPLLVFGEGEYGVTDILYAAARSKDSEVFRVILDFASCPRFSTGDHQAAAGEIPSGYKLEIMNRALHAAARGGNLGLLKELIGACSDDALAYRDMRGATILHAAAARGQVEVVKYLMTSSSSSSDIINSTDKQGNTALHVAAHRGHLPVVEAIILSSPCSIYTTNNAGETFIHSVVSGFQSPGFRRLDRQIDLLKHLLCKSTNLFDLTKVVNLTNNDGKTALHLAITGNVHSDLVELLMTIRGIDVNIRDKSGMTPLDILRRRPHSASSELLTRQLISAGGIFSSQDYSARRVIASHIRRHSTGNSPGTSFRISDVEIFLYTGMENNASSVGLSNYSPEKVSQHDSNEESKYRASPRKHVNSTAQRLKRFFHWPKMKKERPTSEIVPPVSLRQRFSKPSPVVNSNKRALSVRSNVPSPGGKKKVASGMMDGVMQSFAVGDRKSRSSSFSKFSFSSQSSLDGQRAAQIENEVAKAASCSMQRPHGMGSRRLMNSYLCFGGPAIDSRQPFDVYERSVLSGA